jgi:hypothetical protein
MTWYAVQSKPSDRMILHLWDIRPHGNKADSVPELKTEDDVHAYLVAHPEIDAVNVYDSRFPQRPIPIARFDAAMIARLFQRTK